MASYGGFAGTGGSYRMTEGGMVRGGSPYGGGYGGGYPKPDAIQAYKASKAGGGGVTSGVTPGASTPQMPYQPQGPQVQNLIDPLAQAGQGLLDPSSAYHQRMQSQLSKGIGETSAAQQRAAALRAAQSGMGGGASPELLETQADIGRSGLEATGDAYGRAMLGGMELGGQLLSPALSGQLGLQGQQLQAYLAQQQGAQNQEAMQFQAALEQQRLQQQMLLQQMQMFGSMY